MKAFTLVATFSIFGLILFSHCNSGTTNTSTDQDTLEPKISDTLPSTSETAPPRPGGAEEEAVEKDYSAVGFELLKTEGLGELTVGISTKQVETILGKPNQQSKAEVWEADGYTHQMWTYKKHGLELDMGGETANALELMGITALKSCALKTKRNIGIGSSMNEVMSAYQKEIDKESSDTAYIVAGSMYGGLIFTLKNQKVSSIFIGAAAE